MADATPNVKKFLDYAGLSQFWGIITNRFADKNKTITKLSISTSDDGKTQTLVGSMIDTTATPSSVALPNATKTQAGLMSADHFAVIDDLKVNIDKMAPFAGLQLRDDEGNDNEVSLTGRKATIELQYLTDRGTDGTATKAYIALVDPTYPSEGSWAEKTKAEYDAATSKTSWTYWIDGTETKYAVWSVEGSIGPVNSVGKPIMSKPISKIDVTELLKTGLLTDSDVVILGADNTLNLAAGTYLKLTFNAVKENGEPNPQTQYINVTDLIDTYTAGEGITIGSYTGTDAKDDPRVGEIKVNAATDTTLGAIKTGYTEGNKTYAVKLDGNNKAYVAVPWNETTVAVSTPEDHVDKEGKPYVVVTDMTTTSTSETDGSTTTKYAFSVKVGEGVQKAEAAARSSVQTVNGDPNYVTVTKNSAADYNNSVTVTLDQTVKDSLALADTAVQTVAVGNVERGGETGVDLVITPTADADQKGKKGYTITLGARTTASLEAADSAMQEITVLGKTLNQSVKGLTAAEAKQNMELGTAAIVNTVTEVSDANFTSDVTKADGTKEARATVATTEAVKTYVDAVAGDTKTKYEGLIKTTIESLDSELTTTKVGASSNAQGVDAQQIFTKIVITDGKLDTTASTKATLTLSDITDFRPFTEAEINEICGVTA